MSQNVYDNIRTRVIVLQENQLLLLNDEGTWRLPGGGLEPYESLLECAAREVHEETGIEVEATSIAFLGEWVYPTYAPCPRKRMQYGYTLEVHIYAHPISPNQSLQQEGPDFPLPAWVPLSRIAQLPLWPKELKTLATTLLAGKAVPGVPTIIKRLEGPRATPPIELPYTQITFDGKAGMQGAASPLTGGSGAVPPASPPLYRPRSGRNPSNEVWQSISDQHDDL